MASDGIGEFQLACDCSFLVVTIQRYASRLGALPLALAAEGWGEQAVQNLWIAGARARITSILGWRFERAVTRGHRFASSHGSTIATGSSSDWVRGRQHCRARANSRFA